MELGRDTGHPFLGRFGISCILIRGFYFFYYHMDLQFLIDMHYL